MEKKDIVSKIKELAYDNVNKKDENYVNKLKTQKRLLEDSNRELTKRLKDERKNAKKTIEDLKEENDILKYKVQHLEEKICDIEQDIEDNCKRIPVADQYEASDRDFIDSKYLL